MPAPRQRGGGSGPPFAAPVRQPSPARYVAGGFLAAVLAGTVLLLLPVSRVAPQGAPWVDALFTATSAVCVTGLAVVDTATYWSPFGQAVILGLIQLGGLGVMTSASLLALLLARRLGVRARLTAGAESRTLATGDVRRILLGIVRTSLVVEVVVAAVLALRFALTYGEPPARALWLGVFHAVSAFNNAGFGLYSDNLVGFVDDPWICLPVSAAVIIGGLGFPVLLELRRHLGSPLRWGLGTRLVLLGTAVLLPLGAAVTAALEWRNPATLGPLDVPGKLLAAFFHSVVSRTAGFNTLDVGAFSEATLLSTDLLMLIGGGPAGTAGGLKITTIAVLVLVVVAEVRGEESVTAFGKRLSRSAQREALALVALAAAAVTAATFVLLLTTDHALSPVLFEAVSAFATTGLSTGITGGLPDGDKLLLVVLMFAGRIGPVTFASALALKQRPRLYELPEERPVIG
ncbi:potassium uptake TrkH family protein [Kineococcus xinjiangensis]|uniref:Potassium uptake TrkH family protein n=1 Tax=Kineococcus xinjiangensis TaxID=512762 RepID=A0A2S6IC73_9ACTN|nr:potassium transporter TrkG [Kineococcus xinjiangensis]PPK90800.1 potassium uptake TrkH family protein [Kineococcus xinjiangensis]